MTEAHEHQFPEVDADGTLVTYPCLLCGLPVGDALKLAADDRLEADRLLAEKNAQIADLTSANKILMKAYAEIGGPFMKAEKLVKEQAQQIAALRTEISDLRVVIDVLDGYRRETPAPPQEKR